MYVGSCLPLISGESAYKAQIAAKIYYIGIANVWLIIFGYCLRPPLEYTAVCNSIGIHAMVISVPNGVIVCIIHPQNSSAIGWCILVVIKQWIVVATVRQVEILWDVCRATYDFGQIIEVLIVRDMESLFFHRLSIVVGIKHHVIPICLNKVIKVAFPLVEIAILLAVGIVGPVVALKHVSSEVLVQPLLYYCPRTVLNLESLVLFV